MEQAIQEFRQLVERVRLGERDAAAELVRLYEPEIRRSIRVRLTDPRLRRVIDSLDVCQSVLANFFVRVSLGEFDLDQPSDLIRLLVAMVRHKVVDQTRRHHADIRDARRVEGLTDSRIDRLPSGAATPERIATDRDLLNSVRSRLSEEERFLADQRALGREWPELAKELASAPDALRKKLSRALDRVSRELRIEDPDDE
jgi:RNA polymerase sigma-70 factor (ECF subfamily)